MFDIFYSGPKPNLFAHEQQADSIEHAQELSRTRYFWWVNYLTDYSQHDFLWEPVPWEANQTHVWPSQWQDNGGTALVPKSGGKDVNYKHPQLPRKGSVAKVGIDHGNGLDIECEYRTRYISDYLGTLRRVLSKVTEEYVWVVSSVCDYTWFDFTWHSSEWQKTMLQVFPSQEQKFGDTFYVHVPTFLAKSQDIKLLEWFDTIHFVENITVPRRPVPIVEHNYDTHVQAVWEHDFVDPVVEFTVHRYTTPALTLNLWREEVKAVTPLTLGASRVLVPREAKNYLKTQLYDYPTIDKTQRNGPDEPLDIVFIDNREPNAEYVYQHLCLTAERTNNVRIHRSSGVNGRVAAYRAAAELSTTPWFFAVFAKLWVDEQFDWSWQPDRLQEPKHYIFHALNPVNGLVYGHQAMIAYNKKLVLNNTGVGLDFTLDSAHEVVPIMSGTAMYDETPWMAWRTAFRECIKLKNSPDVESQYRLTKWLTVGNTHDTGQWSIWGAQDAIEYHDSVAGEFAELKKSYDWKWLATYAFMRRGLVPDQ
jgi:hypothetical protein